MGSHLIDGKFQSDKYPTCPRGKVPLSIEDPMAQDLLWEYAQRRRSVDGEFSADLETALGIAGYELRERNNSAPWPRVDRYMSDSDLSIAADHIKKSVDWSKLPKLAAIFENRPSVNRYWHELVALTLTSLEVNGEAIARRNVAQVSEWCPVLIESPFGGETGTDEEYARNRRYLQRCIRDCLERGETPYASHQMLTEALDDRIPEQREKGRQAGLAMRRFFPKRVFYVDYGMSTGMAFALDLYEREHLTYITRRIGHEEETTNSDR